MDIYPHTMSGDHLYIGYDALFPAFWPVNNMPILSAHTRDVATSPVAHDSEPATTGMVPK